MNKRTRITNEVEAAIVALWNVGKSTSDIAKSIGCSTASVRSTLRRNNIDYLVSETSKMLSECSKQGWKAKKALVKSEEELCLFNDLEEPQNEQNGKNDDSQRVHIVISSENADYIRIMAKLSETTISKTLDSIIANHKGCNILYKNIAQIRERMEIE